MREKEMDYCTDEGTCFWVSVDFYSYGTGLPFVGSGINTYEDTAG